MHYNFITIYVPLAILLASDKLLSGYYMSPENYNEVHRPPTSRTLTRLYIRLEVLGEDTLGCMC